MLTVGLARTTDEWETELGRQVRELRLRSNRTQEQVAALANVSLSALRSIERGSGSSLGTLVAVVRALGRTDWLEQLAPPVAVSPMAKLAASRATPKTRQRARAKRPSESGALASSVVAG